MILFRVFLILLLIYLIIRFIGRLLFSYVSTKYSGGGPSYTQQQQYRKREGDVTINYRDGKKKKKFSKDEGEYVGYEEVEE